MCADDISVRHYVLTCVCLDGVNVAHCWAPYVRLGTCFRIWIEKEMSNKIYGCIL